MVEYNDKLFLKDIMRSMKDQNLFQSIYAKSVNESERKEFLQSEFADCIFRELQKKRGHIPNNYVDLAIHAFQKGKRPVVYEPIRTGGWFVRFNYSEENL